MMDVEQEYIALRSGEPSTPCEFNFISPRSNKAISTQSIEQSAASKIASLELGEWYLFDDKSESDEKAARLKLIMNSPHAERLLFTNHNRRKAMQVDYGQMVSYMENETIKLLSFAKTSREAIRDHLQDILRTVNEQVKKERLATQEKERKALARKHRTARKSSRVADLSRQKIVSRLKKKRSIALRRKTLQKRTSAVKAVAQLHPDAWVKLPLMVGTLTPCKLVAVMPGGERYIFANRAGIKVAEYSARQLSNLLITENSEILDTGDEFDRVLSNIIIGLRHSKTQSFDTLSGEVA